MPFSLARADETSAAAMTAAAAAAARAPPKLSFFLIGPPPAESPVKPGRSPAFAAAGVVVASSPRRFAVLLSGASQHLVLAKKERGFRSRRERKWVQPERERELSE